ncbi:alpha-amylase family glycosyl hydrolase [Parapedobacter indicus]|uniref:Alpha-glucosidase n=1 Tax=Parapedobacter indicus TaxID=1477437 RepID=A0A1I3HL09_9SPHI|nr:alpha-amylase family glycosyl hydrolase [Parapedobacter indicus]PPL03080.1 alpha-glucosidase [Parapedobacter indicus]SFI36332.1 alpha-glucosidase [Parapedobacter indicus]
MSMPENVPWWKTAVIYQIYPRSFSDANRDGIGDLQGIIGKLDYLQWLGIRAIWISPIYPSPMADFGYDVSDYTGINPIFGTMADFDRLLNEAHARDLNVLLDFVPNHTSDRHPWFIESKRSKASPKRDWYIWHDGKPDGSAPNNWKSVFGGDAWEWDADTEQYYYHGFLKEQPDLNWRNSAVQEAMYNAMRFWLDKGVDGFRVDVMWHMIKDAQLRDNPPNPDYVESQPTYNQLLPVYSTDQPEVHAIVAEMRKVVDAYGDRVIIGEIYLPIQQLMAYYGPQNDGAHMPFNFLLLNLPWHAPEISAAIDQYEGALPAEGWPNWVLGNHDRPRLTSRIGEHQARVAAVLLLTLRGTPTLYYGDEIGMHDVPIPAEEIRDPQGLNMPDKDLSRDPCRTPMQWSDRPYAGFSEVAPWLRVDKKYARVNVEAQRNNYFSMLSLYRKLIQLRNGEPALNQGTYTPISSTDQLIAYRRDSPHGDSFLIILNLTSRPCRYRQTDLLLKGQVVVATAPELEDTPIEADIYLSGDEGIVVRLEPIGNTS